MKEKRTHDHYPRCSLFPFGRRRRTDMRKINDKGHIATGVNLDPEMYKRLFRTAQKEATSFSEQIRKYIQWGFMSEDGDV